VTRLLCLLLLSSGASAQLYPLVPPAPSGVSAPSAVQFATCKGTSPLTCSFGSGATAGDSIVVFGNSAFLDFCTSVTSTPSNTWINWGTASNNVSANETVFVATNVASGTNSIVATCSGSTEEGIGMVEVSPSIPDVIGTTFATGTAVSIPTANAVGAAKEYIVAAGWNITGTGTWTAGTGYTEREFLCLDSISCSTTYYGMMEDANTTSGLSGVQTATMTSGTSRAWVGSILTMAPTVTQDANVTNYINWDGLSNTVEPTNAQLTSSQYGPQGTWNLTEETSALTGTTASNACTAMTSFTLGATNWIGTESPTQLLYTTVTGGADILYTLPSAYSSLSWGGCITTNIPQNETSGHRYSLTTLNTTTQGNDYNDPQIRTTGSTLNLFLECPAATQSSSDIVIGTTPNTYWYTVQAVTGGTGHNHQLAIYNPTTGAQVGSTLTCVSETGPYNWNGIEPGDTGSETEATGDLITFGPIKICTDGAFPCGP
jgi:hypothetical protein